ncbi:hypothetical protein [Escherichia coli]|uniref:hypothetical protein n=1 Tax=Escherichia coli TaxID=562 RepID=UPI0020230522|nr:hypothetical protein [Escherichia coli]
MKISLEDKLNLIRAKDYASKLNGVTSFDVSFLRKNDFMWHREMLMAINKPIILLKGEFSIYLKY